MHDESVLRDRVRQLLHTNRLPPRQYDRAWGGSGAGLTCTVCEQPITRTDCEIAIQFSYDGADPHLDKFHLHVRCFAAWELERTKTAPPPAPHGS